MNEPLLQQEPPLNEFTGSVGRNVAISWYRTKLPPGVVRSLHAKSDLKGGFQTLGYLALQLLPALLTLYCFLQRAWWPMARFIFLYGMVAAFLVNAIREPGHTTVFKTKWLNTFFCHLFAFPGLINHETFQSSHIRHHRYTLHPPDDFEVVLPVKLILWHVFKTGFFCPLALWDAIKEVFRIASGKFEGEWDPVSGI